MWRRGESASTIRDVIECYVTELIFWVIEFVTSAKLVDAAKHYTMALNRDIFLWPTKWKYLSNDGKEACVQQHFLQRATRILSD